MNRALLVSALALLAAGVCPGQSANFSPFGTGCTANALTPVPDLLTQGLPRPGSTFTLQYVGGNEIGACAAVGCVQQPVLLLGASNVSYFGVPLPFQVPGLCPLRVSPDIFLPMPISVLGGQFVDALNVQVPNVPGLLGAVFHAQWLTFDRGELLASSKGVTGTIGT